MPRLLVNFESQLIKEINVGSRPLAIGRAPDSDCSHRQFSCVGSHAVCTSKAIFSCWKISAA